ncbi:MAG TPA: sulfatase [Anaerohalosphaeraceae bacterium]|jgi:arylsulfatase A-like enzyme|nr:sulfatase [Anaerohalosphaeraceae bacterium]HRT50553.1 sulfatase [Anaerohalosphaeraceae bacterium]HRT86507.1 sulfatase [Anaerohalosphaeraceae bacterium]
MKQDRLNRRTFLKHLGLTAAALAAAPLSSAPAESARKLNFVFFLIDDMGWTDLGCFGSTFYETPNIDRLARQGVRFTNAYAACPVCSPTRASIMTGKYPARVGITNYIPGRREGKLIEPDYLFNLPLAETTVAEAFKEAGYRCGFVGKWHLCHGPEEENCRPDRQGFDVNKGGFTAGAPRGRKGPFEGGFFPPYNNPALPDGPEGEYLTDRLTNEALTFIETNKDRPFFLYLSHYAVHNPQQAKPEYIEKYKAKLAALPPSDRPEFLPEGKRQVRQIQKQPVYAAMIQSVDDSVGRIMAALELWGLADNTAIFFTSDNGGLSTSEGSPTANVPLRAGKGWLYEGGIRVPLIVKWPNVAEAGSTSEAVVTSTDFYPTLLQMAGLPLKPSQHADGTSFVDALRGRTDFARGPVYWHYPHYGNQGGTPGGAVRAGVWKLVEFYEDMRVELYNLAEDISEKNNLAARLPEKANELRQMLHAWRKQVSARMPTPNPNYKGGEARPL